MPGDTLTTCVRNNYCTSAVYAFGTMPFNPVCKYVHKKNNTESISVVLWSAIERSTPYRHYITSILLRIWSICGIGA